MRKLLILLLTIFFFMSTNRVEAEIINGYEQELKTARLVLRNMKMVPSSNLNKEESIKYKKFVKTTREKIRLVEDLYIKTEVLIASLRLIDPELYKQVDHIQDHEGNITDVYVHAIDELQSGFKGYTNLDQHKTNPHIYTSEYGDHSVSVSVVFSNTRNSLKTLVHELGHVLYQVPNLANYMEFYKKTYLNLNYKGFRLGHHHTDSSHQMVRHTLQRFMSIMNEAPKRNKKLVRKSSREIWTYLSENNNSESD